MMNTMMEETLLTGTAHKAELPGWQAAGKTGTSQDFRDAWFVGYTSHLVAGVWLGNDDNSPTKKASGGNLPVEIWSRFMKAAHQGVPTAALPSGTWRSAAPLPEPAQVADLVLGIFGAGPAAAPQHPHPAPRRPPLQRRARAPPCMALRRCCRPRTSPLPAQSARITSRRRPLPWAITAIFSKSSSAADEMRKGCRRLHPSAQAIANISHNWRLAHHGSLGEQF